MAAAGNHSRYNEIASPMFLFEEGEILTKDELKRRKDNLVAKKERKSRQQMTAHVMNNKVEEYTIGHQNPCMIQVHTDYCLAFVFSLKFCYDGNIAAFLVGTMAQVSHKISELDQSLQNYTQLVFDSRMSEDDEFTTKTPYPKSGGLASAKQKRRGNK